jgi:hypothetical protein
VSGSVEPKLGDVAWVLFQLAALDFIKDVEQALIGTGMNPDPFTLAHHIH